MRDRKRHVKSMDASIICPPPRASEQLRHLGQKQKKNCFSLFLFVQRMKRLRQLIGNDVECLSAAADMR